MLASDVIDRARDILKDPAAVRWTDDTLLRWVGDGQRAIAEVDTGAASVSVAVQVVGDSNTQTFAGLGITDAVRLLDVPRNMGVDGLSPGTAIREVDYETARSYDGGLNSAPGNPVYDFMYRPEVEKQTFYIYPQITAAIPWYIEVIYLKRITDPTALGDTLAIDTEYLSILVDYIVARALSVDDEEGSEAKSQSHAQAFAAALSLVSGIAAKRDDT